MIEQLTARAAGLYAGATVFSAHASKPLAGRKALAGANAGTG